MKPCYQLFKAQELRAALEDLRGFWKLWSSFLLSSCGLPTLNGIVITMPDPGIGDYIHDFLHVIDSPQVLVRHDKFPETPPHPRGGFLVGKALLPEVIEYFFSLNRIVAVYEKANPFLNMHNINLLFESDREVFIEIVGPGFDSSDLQRGDITPHEAFKVSITAHGTISCLKLFYRIEQPAYSESVRLRKEKIRRKLDSSPTNDLARKIKLDLGIPDDLDKFLKQIDSPLCIFKNYQPLPEIILYDTLKMIVQSQIIPRYMELTGAKFPLNFSTSMINKGKKQAFWDIVSPSLKFEGLNLGN